MMLYLITPSLVGEHQSVCCLSIPTDISRTTRLIFTNFLCMSSVAVAEWSSGSIAICTSGLWMMSCFSIMGLCGTGDANIRCKLKVTHLAAARFHTAAYTETDSPGGITGPGVKSDSTVALLPLFNCRKFVLVTCLMASFSGQRE